MSCNKRLLLAALVLGSVSAVSAQHVGLVGRGVPQHPISVPNLLHVSDLAWQGTFRPPNDAEWGDLDSGGGLAFNSTNTSLFALSGSFGLHLSEVAIPATFYTGSTISSIARTTKLQPSVGYEDPFEGQINTINPTDGGQQVGAGLIVSGTTLVVDAYSFYDANSSAVASHFVRSTTLSNTSITGPFKIGSILNTAFTTGPMAPIPAAWQSRLGGNTHLVGEGSLSIIGRTSWGPSLHAFKLADVIAGTTPATVASLVYYTSTHATMGWYPQDHGGIPQAANFTYWLPTDAVRGIVFPEGYDTVMVFGQHSTSNYGYGLGGDYRLDNPLLPYAPNTLVQAGDLDADGGNNVGDLRLFDLISFAKGEHAYPYLSWVWLFDANDLAAVYAGTKNPWDVLPYQSAQLSAVDTFPATLEPAIAGATYDSATKRIYLVTGGGDTHYPIFHVFTHP